jgi:hypothetical protein
VKRPANVDGELLRLPSRQEHAEVQCVQKSLFTDPPSLFDQLGVHDGDLASRSAETDKSSLNQKPSASINVRFCTTTGSKLFFFSSFVFSAGTGVVRFLTTERIDNAHA